jgi:hypothetical protein
VGSRVCQEVLMRRGPGPRPGLGRAGAWPGGRGLRYHGEPGFSQSKAAKTPLPESWRAMVPRAVPLFGPAVTQLPTQPSA